MKLINYIVENVDDLKKEINLISNPLIKCLSECDNGSELIVIGVRAGHGAKRRLAHLGILPGVKIKRKQAAPFRGPVNIIVKGTSIVIGRGLASKIIVNCGNSCKK